MWVLVCFPSITEQCLQLWALGPACLDSNPLTKCVPLCELLNHSVLQLL